MTWRWENSAIFLALTSPYCTHNVARRDDIVAPLARYVSPRQVGSLPSPPGRDDPSPPLARSSAHHVGVGHDVVHPALLAVEPDPQKAETEQHQRRKIRGGAHERSHH